MRPLSGRPSRPWPAESSPRVGARAPVSPSSPHAFPQPVPSRQCGCGFVCACVDLWVLWERDLALFSEIPEHVSVHRVTGGGDPEKFLEAAWVMESLREAVWPLLIRTPASAAQSLPPSAVTQPVGPRVTCHFGGFGPLRHVWQPRGASVGVRGSTAVGMLGVAQGASQSPELSLLCARFFRPLGRGGVVLCE